MKTTFPISDDLTAALTDDGYCLTVRSEKLDDYDTYTLSEGEWELSHDSLSNRMPEAQHIWEKPEFNAWAHEVKRVAACSVSTAASLMGRKGGKIGGKSTSKAKAQAAKKNGKKGGRPRKQPAP